MANAAKGSIEGKDAFLRAIAGRLGRSEPLTAAPGGYNRGVPEFYAGIELDRDERIELFVRSWTALNGGVRVVRRADAEREASAFLQEIAAAHSVTRALRWDHAELAALGVDEALAAAGASALVWRSGGAEGAGAAAAEPPASAAGDAGQGPAAAGRTRGGEAWARREPLLRAAEQCTLGVVWADAAIANTGTLVLAAGGGKGRSVSLVTETLFAVIEADRLVTRMGEAFALLRERYGLDAADISSSINLITGPSRSADIENDLTIGVHGPGKVYALIVTD